MSLNKVIIDSDNGLAPVWRQAITWTSDDLLSIQPLGTYSNEILIEIQTFSLMKMRFRMSSAKRWAFYLNLSVLT